MPFISGRKLETPLLPNKSFNDGFLEDDSGYKGSEAKVQVDDSHLMTPAKSLNDAFLQDDSGYRTPELSLSSEGSPSLSTTPGGSSVKLSLRTLRKLRNRLSFSATPRIPSLFRSRVKEVKEEPLDVLVSQVPNIITMILVSAILYMTFISGDTQRVGNMK